MDNWTLVPPLDALRSAPFTCISVNTRQVAAGHLPVRRRTASNAANQSKCQKSAARD
jgi:hypothetical protein